MDSAYVMHMRRQRMENSFAWPSNTPIAGQGYGRGANGKEGHPKPYSVVEAR